MGQVSRIVRGTRTSDGLPPGLYPHLKITGLPARRYISTLHFAKRSISLPMPAADLASLKIHDTARPRGSAGKFWGFFAAGLGVLLLVAGAVFALKNRAPVV